MLFNKKNVIRVSDWDSLVEETYGKPYSFQQQDGCKPRGMEQITVPIVDPYDFENENANEEETGVSFKSWLTRDPSEKLSDPTSQSDFDTERFWYRNFYPCVEVLVNDLHEKGLLPKGTYLIDIDW